MNRTAALAQRRSVPLLALVSIGIVLAVVMLGLHPATSLAGGPPPGAIGIEKSNNAGAVPVAPGTEVDYTYVVTNTGNSLLVLPVLSDKIVGGANDGEVACEPLAGPDGDQDNDGFLVPQESWTYHCSTTLNATTTNEACVTALVPNLATPAPGVPPPEPQYVTACAQNTVEVTEGTVGGGAGTPAASVPNSATSLPGFNGPLATVIFGAALLVALVTLAFANVRSARERR